jgi:hypothetical protein
MNNNRRLNVYIYISVLIIIAIFATAGLIVVLEKFYEGSELWEQFALSADPFQQLIFKLLTANVIVFVFSLFHIYFFHNALTADGRFTWTLTGIGSVLISLFMLLSVFFGGVMIADALTSPLLGLETLSFFKDPDVIRDISTLAFVGITVGFVESIIGVSALGFYRSQKEIRTGYLLENLLFIVCVGAQFVLFQFKEQTGALDLRAIQFITFALLTYEFFNALERNSDLYETISQKMRMPTLVTRLTQASIIAFLSFLFDVINVYTYCILLVFWVLAIIGSTNHPKIPSIVRKFASFSEGASQDKVFETLYKKKMKSSRTVESNVYSAILTGICVAILLSINKALIGSTLLFYAVFVLAIPMFLFFQRLFCMNI